MEIERLSDWEIDHSSLAIRPSPLLLIGMGNEGRGDDGVGRVVARRVAALDLPGVDVVEADGDAARLLDLWRDRPTVIVVDGVTSGTEEDPAPGTLHRFQLDDGLPDLPAGFARASTHGFGLAEAVALGRVLGNLPARLIVHGVEVGDVAAGASLSPAVAAAVPVLVERVRSEGRLFQKIDPL